MQKNNPEDIRPLEVDSVTGEYYVRIPEWAVNDQGWYEGTNLQFDVDADEILITEDA